MLAPCNILRVSPLWTRCEGGKGVVFVKVLNYLSTVLGFGHSHKQLHDWLRLGHQRGHHVDDRRELGGWLDTWKRLGSCRG